MMYMLKIFLVTRCKEYTYGTLAAILVLLHLRATKHPVYDSLDMFPGLLNEEPGEISLAILARLQPPGQSSHALLSENYQLIPRLAKTTGTMASICGLTYHSGYMIIKPASTDLSSTVEFFRKTIRDLKTNQFRHYRGESTSWVDAKQAMSGAGNEIPEPYLPNTTMDLLRTAHGRFLKQLGTRWVRDRVIAHLPGFEQFGEGIDQKRAAARTDHSSSEVSDQGWSEDEFPPLVAPPSPAARFNVAGLAGPPPLQPAPPTSAQDEDKQPMEHSSSSTQQQVKRRRRQRGSERKMKDSKQPARRGAGRGRGAPAAPVPVAQAPSTPSPVESPRPRRKAAHRLGFWGAALFP